MEYRNIAIIAHVDHGKTTLVDGLLKQTLELKHGEEIAERAMDSNDLERERGITILAKNTAVEYNGVKINIVDTPGHADFGGEVERVLGMVDGALVLVDAAEGPMPQTRFVLKKAIELGLKPIVVVNKIDRNDARPEEVVNLTFDLMAELGANDDQLDFPVLYAIAREGKAFKDLEQPRDDFKELFDMVLEHIPAPKVDLDSPFQMLVTNLDYSEYLGRIVLGRVARGTVKKGEFVQLMHKDGTMTKSRVVQPFTHLGLKRIEVDEVGAGDIVALAGIEDAQIGETIADLAEPEALPIITVDEPTVSMTFQPNTSPFAGKEGKYVTSRHLNDRLKREVMTNVSLKVEEVRPDEFVVSGRGELHLSILLETMRREGYEVQVGSPRVIIREIDGEKHEPIEHLVIDVPEQHASTVIGVLGARKGQMVNMEPQGSRVRVEFKIPARALFGFRTQFLSMTQGEGIMSHIFDGYAPWAGELKTRQNGSLVSMEDGTSFAYSIWKLQDRGNFFIDAGQEVYVGMIVGENAREQDMNVNVCKNKKLTNVRSSGADEALTLIPPKRLSLEDALEYIADDELVELTPQSIRLRKKVLNPSFRK
ncbi:MULTISPECIES: translational GTPase TypA [Deinococcus]|jgi:GTP-binding protein TypA/BipA|uniref:Large ribosomal subunit assembly factor BipA n=1 Tax=Deinococcus radiodurans (strain ATCC 13939 / DSM 20539 / JCM 16871 / CCUG 27074 / LMG 4051 / NBRC 15346 / NCIMB 9279 / VKM B-1422 / R1) TaxID=243230 RepID=Q9RV32_DEIRA|nr:translational GTPase TypA [Deinococcus radiodurans]AAF10766.1 GTP-binding elongation factor family protein TypA/BipA [Deinococcus radiodurans R1 = ATCC 13939 = DSM 20539]ANC71634.1 GTP-binding protein TypA [Deinococcus radiodurans R1 = ATCC 13939 = DSM 20539]QEM70677.1 translational GTPase TypA [Deinococcus radiodurans]QIP29275.1 translational GTPase TypA [Deinococcus radiodurans]QIP32033.1 translational GTPase TypA [Deinococcus radiodurans]